MFLKQALEPITFKWSLDAEASTALTRALPYHALTSGTTTLGLCTRVHVRPLKTQQLNHDPNRPGLTILSALVVLH